MAGYTDAFFRRICSSLGASYSVSEMISSVALSLGSAKTSDLARIIDGEGPVVLQLFGHRPDVMRTAAEMLLEGPDVPHAPAGIDINMGCPVKKIVSSGDGSALMEDPALAAGIIRETKKACEKHGVPLSVKFRLGADDSRENYVSFGLAAAEAGADRLTLHCRTRKQMYAPEAKPEKCLALREELDRHGFQNVVLCGNGDIVCYDSASRYLEYGCGEVAVGRAALGDPWIFRALSSPSSFVPPDSREIRDLVIRLVTETSEHYGEKRGVLEARSRAAHFVKGFRGSSRIRQLLNGASTLKEFTDIIENSDFGPRE